MRVDRCRAGQCPTGPHSKSCGCPCSPDGCKHASPWRVQDRVTQAQRFLRELRVRDGCVVVPRLRSHYRWIARWWELEAERGYESSVRSREYAANYRWLVELMDDGHKVTADARGVYVEGELASVYMARQVKAAANPNPPQKKRRRHHVARR